MIRYINEGKADKLANNILEKNEELKKLLDELYKIDQQAYMEVCELLREGL